MTPAPWPAGQGPAGLPQKHLADSAGRHPAEGVHLELVEVGVGVVGPDVRSTERGHVTSSKECSTTKQQPRHLKTKLINVALGMELTQAKSLWKMQCSLNAKRMLCIKTRTRIWLCQSPSAEGQTRPGPARGGMPQGTSRKGHAAQRARKNTKPASHPAW